MGRRESRTSRRARTPFPQRARGPRTLRRRWQRDPACETPSSPTFPSRVTVPAPRSYQGLTSSSGRTQERGPGARRRRAPPVFGDQPRRAAERSILAAVRSRCVGAALPLRVKVAVAARLAFIVSTHVERPVQSPVHPLKRDFVPAVAVSVTVVPFA